MEFETVAVHAGGEVERESGGVSPALHLSTTFARDEELKLLGEFQYIREGNPTQERLETALAAIDHGAGALVFASGLAAGAALLQSIRNSARVIFPDDCYYGFRVMAADFISRWGLEVEFVDMERLDQVRAALTDGALLWAETPSNPLLKVVDIAALAELARSVRGTLVVDSTFATPALQSPLALGADVVLHSTTKYLGGHSDVQGGALIFQKRDALFDQVSHARHILGAVSSPFNSWLVLRGIRTLAARMRVHCANAEALAMHLERHEKVAAVFYPGLPSHRGHAIAARQMRAFGGMLSFKIRGSREDAIRVVSRCRLFTRATSLGGVESLIEHRATSEGTGSTAPPELIRVSAGLESAADLVADLDHALR